MLSDERIAEIMGWNFDGPGANYEDRLRKLRAVAEAAVKDAVGGDAVAWLHNLENFQEPRMRPLDENEISRGWTQKPLYTRQQASAADGCRLTSYAEDGSTCTLNLNGQEIYFDRNDHITALAASQPEVRS